MTAGNIGRPLCDVALADAPAATGSRSSSRRSSSTTCPHLDPRSACSPTSRPTTSTATRRSRTTTATRRCSSATPTPARSGSATRTIRRCRRMVAAGAGRAPPLLDRARGPTAGTIAPAAGSMLGGEPAAARAASCRCWATTTWPTRSPRRSRRARPAVAPAAIAGRAAAPSGRMPHRVEPVREVDGVLWINDSQGHQHHLDRGRGRGARPAVRAAARRPAQGRAVHPARRPLLRRALPRGGRLRRGGRPSSCRTCRDGVPVVRGGRLRRGAGHGARRWRRRETRCCCRPPAPATTCSTTTRSAARRFRAAVEACERAGRCGTPASCAGRPACSAW